MSKPKIYTVNGFTGTFVEVADFLNINERTLRSRLHAGWSFDRAINTPVEKSNSVKIPTMLQIGKYRGSADSAGNWFGCKLSCEVRTNSEKAIKRIRNYYKTRFYTIGDYCGTLTAISEDFGCPMSELKNGIQEKRTPEEIINSGGYKRKDS